VPLLDALRALTSFSPPDALPECDLALLGDVLEAHGLAPLASHNVESRLIGAGLPEGFRERLLTSYQGVVNDTLIKLVAFRRVLRDAPDVPVVFLEAAAYLDWLYPHMAYRPMSDVRIALRGDDGARFAERVKGALELVRTGDEGRTAVFSDGTLTVVCQEGLWSGGPPDAPLFERAAPYRAFGPAVGRPSAEDAVLSTVGEQAVEGLLAPLITYVDLRELLRLELDRDYLRRRAQELGLARALHGATLLAAHFFPEVGEAAARVRPPLSFAERVAVERIVEAAKDPARLRHLRGVDEAARLVVAPRPS
jgi:hypothetical protein